MTTELKLEYGLELTWVGKHSDIVRQGAAKLIEAFPVREDGAVEERNIDMTEEEVVELEQRVGMTETTRLLMGMSLEQIKQRYLRYGYSDSYADREAKRLGRELILYDLGVIDFIDPYGDGKGGKNASIRRDVIHETGANQIRTQSRISQRQEERNNALGERIVNSIMEKWRPIGYADRHGLCGVQWNGATNEIELTSPVHRTWLQVETFYKAAYHGFTEVLGLPVVTDSESSGGGHLHVTKQDGSGPLDTDVMYNLSWDACARPYLGWAFNDPNDMTEAAAPIQHLSNMMARGTLEFGLNKGYAVRYATPGHRNREHDNGNNMTTEFRLFEMPQNWGEQRAHIGFVEAWVGEASKPNYIQSIEPIRPWKRGRALGWTREKCINECRKFLVDRLSLKWEDYELIVSRNITDKFTHYLNELT